MEPTPQLPESLLYECLGRAYFAQWLNAVQLRETQVQMRRLQARVVELEAVAGNPDAVSD
jgi:hypothetical protein